MTRVSICLRCSLVALSLKLSAVASSSRACRPPRRVALLNESNSVERFMVPWLSCVSPV